MNRHPDHWNCWTHAKYRLTCVEMAQLIERAGDRCEICDLPRDQTWQNLLYIDHDYLLGRWAVRGLLCVRCNTRLSVTAGFSDLPDSRAYLANPFRIEEPPARRRLILR